MDVPPSAENVRKFIPLRAGGAVDTRADNMFIFNVPYISDDEISI